jgi:hypothetical protein
MRLRLLIRLSETLSYGPQRPTNELTNLGPSATADLPPTRDIIFQGRAWLRHDANLCTELAPSTNDPMKEVTSILGAIQREAPEAARQMSIAADKHG